ncbi:MAG: DUF92 domain-containing protein [Balneolaceae bacterium]
MEKQANYISLFLLIIIAILEGHADDHIRFVVAALLSWSVATIAFYAGWLTLDGRFSTTVVGIMVLGLGGWAVAILLGLFFVTSSFFSRFRTAQEGVSDHPTVRRNGSQVWANGFWPILLSGVIFFRDEPVLLVLAASAISVATADTWASELGRLVGRKTVRITDFKPVPAGTDGGISLIGTLAAASGALFIAVFFQLLIDTSTPEIVFIIGISGLTGCMADSYLGAILEYNRRNRLLRLVRLRQSPEQTSNLVNWISSGIGVLAAFTLLNVW